MVNDEVAGIGSYAFSGCTRLQDFTIPASAKSIGSYAFSGCTGLTEITIPESVTSIGQYAFQNCSNLASIRILSTNLAIDQYAFSGCPASIYDTTTIPGVKLIDGWAVGFTDSLSGDVDLSSVKDIFQGAFNGNRKITSVILPNNLATVPYNAFYNCTSLRTVTIPDTVTRIDGYAFSGCTALQNPVIPESVTSIGSYAFYNCQNITAVNLPEGLKTIGEWAFYNTAIRSLSIPEGVTSVGQYAFYNCKSLPSVSFPASLTRIPDYAFQSCTKLASITLPEGVVSVGRYAFANCTGMKTVTLPTTLSSCGEYAFSGDTVITAVNISDLAAWCGIVFGNAEANPAYYAHALTLGGEVIHDLVVPDGLQKLNAWCFSDNYALTSVTVPEGIPAIPRSAFNRCAGITNAVLPESVANIGMYAFQACNGLTDIDLPAAVTNIADYAFQTCTNLVSVPMPASLATIGNYAFAGCASIEALTFPEGLVSIGESAFENCASLREVTIPLTLATVGQNAFNNDNALEEVFVSDLAIWCGIDFGNANANPASWAHEITLDGEPLVDVVIPEGVGKVGRWAFNNVTNLETVVVPASVTEIAKSAFRYDTGLTNVVFNEGLQSIREYAFYRCSNLADVKLPSTLLTIGEWAFEGCVAFSRVDIPSQVTSIGQSAFQNCTNVDRVVIPASVRTIGQNAFAGCGDLTVEVAEGTTTIPNSLFATCGGVKHVILPESLTSIGQYAFQNCRVLPEIALPANLVEIGYGAFYGCKALAAPRFPDSIVSIGDYAFYGCTNIQALALPPLLASIGGHAFEGCANLSSVAMPVRPEPDESPTDGVAVEVSPTDWGVTTSGTLQSGAIGDNGTSRLAFALQGAGTLTFEWSVSSESDYDFLKFFVDGNMISQLSGSRSFASKSQTLGEGTHTIEWRYTKDGSAKNGSDCGWVRKITFNGTDLSLNVTKRLRSTLSIGESAFASCSKIESVETDNLSDWCNISFANELSNPARIAGGLTLGGQPLEELEFPDEIPYVHAYAFSGFTNLVSVALPSGTGSIATRAFADCAALASVQIPASVTSLSADAFAGCPSIVDATVPGNVRTMSVLFPASYSNVLARATVADGSLRILPSAFSGCRKLEAIAIAESVADIGSRAFMDCQALPEIALPSAVGQIGADAFLGATALRTIDVDDGNEAFTDVDGVLFDKSGATLLRFPGGKGGAYAVPAGTEAISRHAFMKSVAVEHVSIPASVSMIGEDAFLECEALRAIEVAEDNSLYRSIDGILYTKDGKTILRCPAGFRGNVEIAEGVESVAAGAFAGCATLTDMAFPSTIRSIGDRAFANCSGLVNVTFPDGLESIGASAFSGCGSLASLVVPDSVQVLGKDAFADCDALENLVLPAQLPPTTIRISGYLYGKNSFRRGFLYRITGTTYVANGATLDIPSGVIVKFDPGVALYVYSGGTLRAQGTRASPVVFTSIRDDSFGGDTNGDGNSSSPGPGDWDEICNSGGTIEMSYAKVFYGGYGSWSNQGDAIIRTSSGTTTLDGCTIGHTDLRILCRSGGTVTARNTLLIDGRWGWDGNVRFVNGVVYDCSTGASGGTAVNTVFAECPTAASGATIRNCVASGCEAGTNAMTVADAKFVGAANGDFRLAAGSPCIDAGDADAAPETDWYGQSRVGTPDIGLHEWQPRPAQLDVDLEAVSIEVESDSAEVGDILSVDWSVRNAGSNPVSDEWRDTVELVSASGSVVELGTHRATGGILAGGRRSFRASYRIPSVEPGAARIRVKVNPHRDIYEGAATGNNVAYAEGSVEIRLPAWTPEESGGRMLAAGGSVALRVAAGTATAIRIRATGGEVSAFAVASGVPAGLRYDVAAETLPDGSLLLVLPKDADGRDYNVAVFNSDVSSSSFQMEAVADVIAMESASPSRLANTGSGYLAVVGVGMDRVASARLEGPRTIDLADLQVASPARLSATANLSGAPVGTYSLVLVGEDGATVRAAGAVEVYSPKMGPKLEARIETPSQIRQGRVYSGRIVYSNVGDTEMEAPLFKLTPRDASVRLSGETEWQEVPLYVMGIALSDPAGVLRPGETSWIDFEFLSGTSPSFTMNISEDASEKWVEKSEALSEAATVVNRRGRRVCRWGDLDQYAGVFAAGTNAQAVCGMVVGAVDGSARENLRILALSGEGVLLGMDEVDSSGRFVVEGLQGPTNAVLYAFSGNDAISAKAVEVPADGDVTGLKWQIGSGFRIRFAFSGIADEDWEQGIEVELTHADSSRVTTKVFHSPEDADMTVWASGEYAMTVSARYGYDAIRKINVSPENGETEVAVDFAKGSVVSGTVKDESGLPVPDATVALVSAADMTSTRYSVSGENGTFEIGCLEAGNYIVTASAAGYGSGTPIQVVVPANGKATGVKAILRKYANTLSVAVSGLESGKAVFHSKSGEISDAVELDAEGRFLIGGLAEGVGEVHIFDDAGDLVEVMPDVLVKSGANYRSATIDTNKVVFVGNAIDEEGKPVRAVWRLLTAYSDGTTAVSDEAGQVAVSLRKADYWGTVSAGGYATGSFHIGLDSHKSLTVTLTHSGSIKHAIPSDIDKTAVSVVFKAGKITASGRQSAEGEWLATGLPPGEEVMGFVVHPGGAYYTGKTDIRPGETGVVSRVESGRGLRIRLGTSSKISIIRIEHLDGTGFASTFKVSGTNLELAEYPVVEAKLVGYAINGSIIASADIAATQEVVDLSTENGLLSIQGRITGGTSGQFAGGHISFCSEDGVELARYGIMANGSFLAGDVPDGFVRVWVELVDGTIFPVERSEAESLSWQIPMPDNLGISTYKFTDDDGRPLAGLPVVVVFPDGKKTTMTTDSRGTVNPKSPMDKPVKVRNGNDETPPTPPKVQPKCSICGHFPCTCHDDDQHDEERHPPCSVCGRYPCVCQPQETKKVMTNDQPTEEVPVEEIDLPPLTNVRFHAIHHHDWTISEGRWYEPLVNDLDEAVRQRREFSLGQPPHCPDPDCTFCESRFGAYNRAVQQRYTGLLVAANHLSDYIYDDLSDMRRISHIRHEQQLVATIKVAVLIGITAATAGAAAPATGALIASAVLSTGGTVYDMWRDGNVGASAGLQPYESTSIDTASGVFQGMLAESEYQGLLAEMNISGASTAMSAAGIGVEMVNQAVRWHSFDEMMNARIGAAEHNIAMYRSVVAALRSAASTPYKGCNVSANCIEMYPYFDTHVHCRCNKESEPVYSKAYITRGGSEIQVFVSRDPNEMAGPLGVGDPEKERFVKPGEKMDYIIYFENKADAETSAQEIRVTAQLDPSLDWSTFEWGAVSFGNQIDNGLAKESTKRHVSSEVKQDGTDYYVVTDATFDETAGQVTWYLRIFDKTTADNWPTDLHAGILPPNNPETHIGEGYIAYSVNVRRDASPGTKIDAAATIVFDLNDPIPTDPAWWNTVAQVATVTVECDPALFEDGAEQLSLVVGQPYGKLPAPKARAGYSFDGWYTGPNGTGKKISVDMIVESGVTGIYAHWVQTTYSVVFDANGGAGKMAAQKIAPGATAKLLANKFTKSGCVFLGWAKTKTGAVAYANGASVKNLAAAGKSVTLYAQWAVAEYKIAFNGNGGKLPKKKKMKALSMTYGTSKKLPKNLFARKGYVFIGWSTKKKGPVEFPNKASVKNLTTKDGTVTLYAQWAKEKYKVAFYANGGKGKMATQAMTYGKAKKLSANKFKAPKGMKFAGWAKSKADAKKGKVAFKDKKSVKNLVTTGKTVKLYAVWKKK